MNAAKKPGPKSDAERVENALAVDPDWLREMRLTLAAGAKRMRERIESGEVDDVVLVGMVKAVAEVVNDRDSILEGDDEKPPGGSAKT